jgi:hypothetical protein
VHPAHALAPPATAGPDPVVHSVLRVDTNTGSVTMVATAVDNPPTPYTPVRPHVLNVLQVNIVTSLHRVRPATASTALQADTVQHRARSTA